MARYNEVDQRIWNSRDFQSLSIEGKLLWLFLLTGPHNSGLPAIYRIGYGYLHDELGWEIALLKDIIREELEPKKMVSVDTLVNVFHLPSWYKYSAKPKQSRVLKSWLNQLDNIPDCHDKFDYIERLIDFLEDTEYGGSEMVREWKKGNEIILAPTNVKKKKKVASPPTNSSKKVDKKHAKISRDFYDKAKVNLPKMSKAELEKTINKGAEEIDKLVRLDGYTEEQVVKTLEFALDDDFWKRNLQVLTGIRRKSMNNGLTKFENIRSKVPAIYNSKVHGRDAMNKYLEAENYETN